MLVVSVKTCLHYEGNMIFRNVSVRHCHCNVITFTCCHETHFCHWRHNEVQFSTKYIRVHGRKDENSWASQPPPQLIQQLRLVLANKLWAIMSSFVAHQLIHYYLNQHFDSVFWIILSVCMRTDQIYLRYRSICEAHVNFENLYQSRSLSKAQVYVWGIGLFLRYLSMFWAVDLFLTF